MAINPNYQSAVQRRLTDSRGAVGRFSRGSNIYGGTSHTPNPSGNNGTPPASWPYNPLAWRDRPQTVDSLAADRYSGDSNVRPGPGMPTGGGSGQPYPEGHPPFIQGNPSDPAFAMSFDPQFAAAMREFGLAQGYLTSDYEQSGRDLELGRIEQERQLLNALTDALTSTDQNFADRGTLHSGVYVDELGNVNERYIEGQNSIESGYSEGVEGLNQGYARANDTLLTQLESLLMENARREMALRESTATTEAENIANQQSYEQYLAMVNNYLMELQPVLTPTGTYAPPTVNLTAGSGGGP